jgi:hypothetical protein
MREKLIKAGLAAIVTGLTVSSVLAQKDEQCRGAIYTTKEVARRAAITEQADFRVIYEAFGNDVQAHVVVEAVLCRSGRVTDIKVIDISPPKIRQFVVDALSFIRFKPAEMNYHTVSQRQEFEFSINGGSVPGIEPAVAAGRLIESLDIMGNRRFTSKEVQSWIKSRAGEPLKAQEIQEDLSTLLATGFFHKSGTRVFIEEGVRGGVGVHFEVHELPVIGDVRFEGLKIDQSLIIKAWQDAGINLQAGTPYAVETVVAAIRIIKQVLDLNRLSYSSVEPRVELLTSQISNLAFVVTTK